MAVPRIVQSDVNFKKTGPCFVLRTTQDTLLILVSLETKSGGATGIRTLDIQLAKLTL
jgi:hypothetical protein